MRSRWLFADEAVFGGNYISASRRLTAINCFRLRFLASTLVPAGAFLREEANGLHYTVFWLRRD